MTPDIQGRLTIPSIIRLLSSVKDTAEIALMMEEPNIFYLVPRSEYAEGKLIDFCKIDNKNRVFIPKRIRLKDDGEWIIYLDNGKIYLYRII